MKSFASLCAVAITAVAAVPAAAAGKSAAGVWSGEMRQVDVESESKYPMSVKIEGTKGASSYPTLKCGGVWSRIGETKDGYAIYKEKIINEPGATCVDGIVIVHVYAGKLVLGWFTSFEGTPSLASAVLARESE